MKKYGTSIFNTILFFLISITPLFSTAYTSTSGGDWMTPGRWTPAGPPVSGTDDANLNTITIQAGHTVTISGEDIALAYVVIHVYGTLRMSNQGGLSLDYANLNLTGANSGLILHNGGTIEENVILAGALNIRVNGSVVWNGGADGNVSNNTGSPIYYPIGLPVELVKWDIITSGKTIEAQWTTASEKNNAFFTIEFSEDGSAFEAIGNVDSKGNSTNAQEYSYAFETAKTGLVYFRLKQTDYDGKFSHSEIISKTILSTIIKEASIFPNPVTNNNFSVYNMNGNLTQLTLMNLQSGTEAFRQDFETTSAITTIELPTTLPKGLYLVKMIIDNNVETKTLAIY